MSSVTGNWCSCGFTRSGIMCLPCRMRLWGTPGFAMWYGFSFFLHPTFLIFVPFSNSVFVFVCTSVGVSISIIPPFYVSLSTSVRGILRLLSVTISWPLPFPIFVPWLLGRGRRILHGRHPNLWSRSWLRNRCGLSTS